MEYYVVVKKKSRKFFMYQYRIIFKINYLEKRYRSVYNILFYSYRKIYFYFCFINKKRFKNNIKKK